MSQAVESPRIGYHTVEAFLNEYAAFNMRLRLMDQAALATAEVPFLQAVVLKLVAEGVNRPHLISDRLHAQSQTVTGTIDRLEAKGLITRTHGTDDRRAVLLALAPWGESLMPKVEQALAAALA